MMLPDREVVVERLDVLIENARAALAALPTAADTEWTGVGAPTPKLPTLYLVAIDGSGELRALDPAGFAAAMQEVSRRLDRLVRSSDVLGNTADGTFALVAASVASSSAGALVERVAGAVAMPLQIDGNDVSLRALVAMAFASNGSTAESVMTAAEFELDALLDR